ncbi:PatB family C-S lyase [Denitratisoma sp. agr-D3]
MAGYDFDTPIDRRDSDSMKWSRYRGRDVIPLWVADMDFAAPPPVLAALHKRVDHGVFGYAKPWPSLTAAVIDHLRRHYAWKVEAAWIVWIPGVVAAFNAACRAVGGTGANVFTATPVYPPFLTAPANAGRHLVTQPLVQSDPDGRWGWDFAATARSLAESRARLWLLCHPHNPVGRVWRDDELAEIGRLAEKHDLVVCSDEIHCGLVLDPALHHRPLASLSPQLARRTITLMAPSKTFNIPALYSAFAVIADPALRRAFSQVMEGIMPHINTLGLVATEAAYRDGDEWREALIDYLRGNARRVEAAVATMDGLSMTPVEATYLAWIDCRALCQQRGIDDSQKFFEAAGVGLSDGRDFGLPGFVRLNFGCPRALLDEALARMTKALA